MPAQADWPRAVLFDLDGTLIDSVPDITLAVADLLKTEGLAPVTEPQVRAMVGHGVQMLVKRAFAFYGRDLEGDALAAMTERMLGIYPRHLIGRTVLMPGAREALDALAAAGRRLAVVTNKPESFVAEILSHLGIAERFALIAGDRPLEAGGRPALRPKPAPDLLLHALDQLGATPAETVMVGDSGADIQSAKAAQVFAVGIRGGYSTTPLETFAPDLVLDGLADLPGALIKVAGRHH
jgi:phosphoglycolate phosphatase